MINSFTTSGEETKILTSEELKKIIDELRDPNEPKALVLIPNAGGLTMYEVEVKYAKAALTMQSMENKNPELYGPFPKMEP